MKEELEASKQRAEREMRETRLRSLELKAAVARTAGHSATLRNSQEALLAQNTRLNASADKRAGSAVAEKATPAAVAAHQGYVAEEVSKHS